MLRLDASLSEDDNYDQDSDDGHAPINAWPVAGASGSSSSSRSSSFDSDNYNGYTNAVMKTDGKIIRKTATIIKDGLNKARRTVGDVLIEIGKGGLETKADGTFPRMVALVRKNGQVVKRIVQKDKVVIDLHKTIERILGDRSNNTNIRAAWYRIAHAWVNKKPSERNPLKDYLSDGFGDRFDWDQPPEHIPELDPFGYKPTVHYSLRHDVSPPYSPPPVPPTRRRPDGPPPYSPPPVPPPRRRYDGPQHQGYTPPEYYPVYHSNRPEPNKYRYPPPASDHRRKMYV